MTDCNVRLAEIEALANSATPGPWTNCDGELGVHEEAVGGYCSIADCSGLRKYNERIIDHDTLYNSKVANAAFIAAARTDVLWLIDQLRHSNGCHAILAEKYARKWRQHNEANSELRAALTRAERAEAALLRYGRHTLTCDLPDGNNAPCTCGLDAARNAVATKGDNHE